MRSLFMMFVALLKKSQEDFMGGKLNFFEEKFKNHDDVHMNMEARLIDKLGMDVGGRMHTTRSRNDQVSFKYVISLTYGNFHFLNDLSPFHIP